MSHVLPTGRHGQLLALGLTVLVLAGLGFGAAMPLLDWHAERADLLVRRAALAERMEAVIAGREALRRQVAAMAGTGDGDSALLAGDSDSTASAGLQEMLQSLFAGADLQLNTVETMPADDAGAWRRIRLRLSFNASWPVLMGLLKQVQSARPALLVDELQVQPALHRINTAAGTFDVSCTIFALRSQAARTASR